MTDACDTSRVLTLVFTDLADSTALKTQRGDVAVGDLISRHREHVTRIAAESSGRVIDWAGDGCFLTFETSSAAVLFSLRLQQAHADESDLPGVRIGVHMGEVTEKPGPGDAPRIEGLAVDIAARISGLTKPGQVLMSASVYNSARQRIGVDAIGQPILWQLHGSYSLKGFDSPMDIGEAGVEGMSPLQAPESSEKAKLVKRAPRNPDKPRAAASTARRGGMTPMLVLATLLVVAVGAIAYLLSKQGGSDGGSDAVTLDNPITSLAVLPFDNLMGDPEQEYFVDGMTDILSAELAKIHALRVLSRTSAMRYKDTDLSIREIAAEIGADALIEGSILRAGNDVRITAQLIDGRSDRHLWAESYDGTLENILSLQAEVARDIAKEIRITLTPEDEERLAVTPTLNPDAHDAYLKGRFFWNQRTEKSAELAIQYFEEAKRIDPTYARAYSGLSDVYHSLWAGGYGSAWDLLPRAGIEAQRALELDPSLAEAHASLATKFNAIDLDWDAAREEMETAIRLDPSYASARQWYGLTLAIIGDYERAIAQIKQGIVLEPASMVIRLSLGSILAQSGDISGAIAELENVLRMDPDFPVTRIYLAEAYIDARQYTKAIETIESAARLRGMTPRMQAILGSAYARMGRTETARGYLDKAISDPDAISLGLVSIAGLYVDLGDMESAYDWMDRAYRNRDLYILFIRHALGAKPFYGDPRFDALLERMKFPPLTPEEIREARANRAVVPTQKIEKIAVLPFDNMSSDPEQEYFVDGMTEALIAELAKIRSIKVISRTSAMRYKDSDKPLTQIARELGVDALIEGSVLKAGNEVRITAQLIHGHTDEHLWAESYNGTLERVLSLQSDVALAIAGEIKATVTPEEEARLALTPTVDPEAHDAYLRGRHFWWKRTREGVLRSVKYFEEAVRIDPNYARGYAGLADGYSMLSVYLYIDPAEGFPKAKTYALKAVDLDENLAAAYTALGFVRAVYERDWKGAFSDFNKSIELNPNFTQAYFWYADVSAFVDNTDVARSMVQEGLKRDRLSGLGNVTALIVEEADRNYEAAIEIGRETLRLDPDYILALWWYGKPLLSAGHYEEAVRNYERLGVLSDRNVFFLGYLGMAYAGGGEKEKALDVIEEIRASKLNPAVLAAALARVHVALGEHEKALDYLEQTLSVGQFIHMELYRGPEWDPLRDDPRFQRICDRLNYPELKNAPGFND